MTETGVVESVAEGAAVVVFERSEQCGKCNACARGSKDMRAVLPNEIGARAGQRVTVEIPDGRVVRFSFITYIIPLAALLLGILLGAPAAEMLGNKWSGELCGACMGILLMVAAFMGVRAVDKRVARHGTALKLTGIADEQAGD